MFLFLLYASSLDILIITNFKIFVKKIFTKDGIKRFIDNGIDFNFSCIMKLKEITSVIIPSLLNTYSLNKVILKRKEEIEKLQNVCNILKNIFEVKEEKIDTQNVKKLQK